MKKYLSNFRDGLKLYGKAPEVTSLLALLALTTVIVIADAFFLPSLLKTITIVVFLGVAVILTSNNLRLLRSRIDAKLKTNELQAVIGNMQDGIIVYDTNYKIIAANPATETITGLRTGELIGEKITPSFVNKPRFKIISQIMFPSLAASATQISSETWPQVVDISIEEPSLKIRTNLNRVLDEDGKMVGFLKIIQD
ncbi:MAG: PAS domain-containing protein, partial [Patescibacteria group bacterium]